MLFRSVAQSGKSTIGNVVKSFFKCEDVAVLSSNIEKKFGLQAIIGRLVFICFEVTKNWGLSRDDFQSLISGEDMSIAFKNMEARTIKWSIPGLLLGNELGPWVDAAGSLVRRLMVLHFKNRVTKMDPDLDVKLDKELPRLMYKCYWAYKQIVKKYKGRDI